jgi:hypothetical protein
VGGWTDAETKAWEKEQQASKEAPEEMEERVHKAVREFRRDPEAVSKKTEERGHQEYGRATGQKNW